jgi:hypothetical protein
MGHDNKRTYLQVISSYGFLLRQACVAQYSQECYVPEPLDL